MDLRASIFADISLFFAAANLRCQGERRRYLELENKERLSYYISNSMLYFNAIFKFKLKIIIKFKNLIIYLKKYG